jgi:hypothetical protein
MGRMESPTPSPQTPPPAADEPELRAARALDRLEATIRLAAALARAARPLDLSGLDEEAGRACAYVLDCDPATGRRLAARLTALLAEVDALLAALQQNAPPSCRPR